MKDVTLTGEAVPLRAAVPERLDAGQGDANRIGVVAMRRKRLADEPRFQTLYPCAAAADPDAVSGTAEIMARTVAQAFKTPRAALI